jgi:arylsulfatase A-like enzyme
VRPHPPLDPPAAWLDHFLAKPLPPLPEGDWVDHDLPPAHGVDSPVPSDPAAIDLARRAYYAQLAHLDFQVNRLVMALHDEGVLEDTVIVFTSDHGDMLYDHKLVAKSLPYEGSARVPFILRLPAGVAGAPRVVDAPVELRDLFPSLCDAAGLDIPADLDGRSVLPLCRGEEASWRPWLHGEHTAGPRSNHWLTDGHQKYLWFSQSGREQLFDLDADPTESRDLAAVTPERVARWRARLSDTLAEAPEGFVSDGRLIPGRPQHPLLAHAGVGA